jgi:hypothetical protein
VSVVSEDKSVLISSSFPVIEQLDKLTCSVRGGNLVGANSFWFNDGKYLVEKSVNSNLPVVIVALKYASQSIAMRFPPGLTS